MMLSNIKSCYFAIGTSTAALKTVSMGSALGLGYYWFDSHIAGDAGDATLYHEATHQLFRRFARRFAIWAKNNFWIVEAIACYTELLTEHEGFSTLVGAAEGGKAFVLSERFHIAGDRLDDPEVILVAQIANRRANLLKELVRGLVIQRGIVGLVAGEEIGRMTVERIIAERTPIIGCDGLSAALYSSRLRNSMT